MMDTDSNDDDGASPRSLKRQGSAEVEVSDTLVWARQMWQNRDPTERRAVMQEDRDFRETFGCGPFLAKEAWQKLNKFDYLPQGGTIENFLWALCFCKLHTKTKAMCTLCGGTDAKTLSKWAWACVDALTELEGEHVSVCHCCVPVHCYCCSPFCPDHLEH